MQELAKTVNDKATKRIAIASKCSINRLKTDNNVMVLGIERQYCQQTSQKSYAKVEAWKIFCMWFEKLVTLKKNQKGANTGLKLILVINTPGTFCAHIQKGLLF